EKIFPRTAHDDPRRDLRLTGAGECLQLGRVLPEVADLEWLRGAMSDQPREGLEEVRWEKLRRIADLGLDPWGHRFDGHQAIGLVRAEAPPHEPEGESSGVMVRVAGRIMLRRGQGKVIFLELRDWTGRIQIFLGQKQVGALGWKLAELLDLGD